MQLYVTFIVTVSLQLPLETCANLIGSAYLTFNNHHVSLQFQGFVNK